MKKDVENTITENILPKVKELGFDIEYVEFVKEGNQNILRVVIDKINSSINIDDCELVSRSIENIIDKYIKIEYLLEVSSPGLERQLKNMSLYKKYIGNEIYVKLFEKVNNKKEIEGTLESVDEENNCIVVINKDSEFNININNITNAHTIYNFSKELEDSDNVNINELKKF